MFRFLLQIGLLALLIVPCIAQDAEYKPPRKWTFGSMGIAMRADLEVFQGGARNEAGEIVIKEKDRLLKWGGKELKTLDDFCRQLYATKPGDIIEVEISRPIEGKEERETLTVKIKLADPKVAYKELHTHLDKRKRTYDWRNNEAVTKGGPLREKLWPRIQKHKLERDWDNLIAAQERELDLWDSYENLSSTDLLLSDPLAAHQWISRLGAEASELQQLIPAPTLMPLLDVAYVVPPEFEAPIATPQGDGIKDQYEAFGNALNKLMDQLDPLPDQRELDGFKELQDKLRDFVFAWRGDEGFEKSADVVASMRSLQADYCSVLASLPETLNAIGKLGKDAFDAISQLHDIPRGVTLNKIEGDHWLFHDVLIGGPGRNVYDFKIRPPRLIVDVGGDDEYRLPAYASFAPATVIVDLGGADTYRGASKWGVACGVLGTSIIDDREGNDTYECGDWGIGAAFGGIGLLIDRKGNDRYLGGTNSIGCAAYGVGGVIDLEGNDVYDGHSLSVGVGQPGGVGFVLDHSGDDRYRCTGETPSSYGTEGEWFGGGIGCGFGWRTLACGGIGLVVDVKGNDIYDAGEFGLGCGYFMAIGAVRDMDGDDIYHSSRYGLAAAAHAAVGVFMDDKGNDTYEGKTAASIGGTWDIVTGYFYDGAGDDNYRCDGLGLGACAQNGFGIFWDAGGDDNYRSGSGDHQHGARTIGAAGGAEYGGGRLAKNFGIFIDSGGTDTYPRKNRANGQEVLEGEFGLFVDE